MPTIFKSVALTSVLFIAGTAHSRAADICDERGFARVPAGQIRVNKESTGEWIEFRTGTRALRDGYAPETASTEAAIARQAARDAIYSAYARIVRPPTAAAPLEFHGLQSTVTLCDGENTFDFRVPLSGLTWRTGSEEDGPEMLPPIKNFLRDNGVID
ncbi:hypothetical protein P3T40_002986 [Paraburkholderia sp. EB58]|jgi:hypothetical protein|uniref:hypothetical protein n=1 Tax=Paraburkholderia sp. EB58 TaxID=3035125 RepID=UPI003D2041CB